MQKMLEIMEISKNSMRAGIYVTTVFTAQKTLKPTANKRPEAARKKYILCTILEGSPSLKSNKQETSCQ